MNTVVENLIIDVAVLGGGASLEHDVSLESARAVCAALATPRWRVWPTCIGRDGQWRVADAPATDFDGATRPAPPALSPGVALDRLRCQGVGLVFPALHGEGGEDGRLQGLLDLHGVRYVGSGVAASAVAMDKLRTRECLLAHGLPMARGVAGRCPTAPDEIDALLARVAVDPGLPCFAKIDASGSSFGVARWRDVADARRFFAAFPGRRFVTESELHGEEISVPVVGAASALQALPPIGIYPPEDAGFFSSEAKYDGRTVETVPPRGLDERAIAVVQDLALRAHRALDCRHVSRTDMIVTAEGPQILEVNTLPGMTPASLLPKCAAALGWSFQDLVERLLDLALTDS